MSINSWIAPIARPCRCWKPSHRNLARRYSSNIRPVTPRSEMRETFQQRTWTRIGATPGVDRQPASASTRLRLLHFDVLFERAARNPARSSARTPICRPAHVMAPTDIIGRSCRCGSKALERYSLLARSRRRGMRWPTGPIPLTSPLEPGTLPKSASDSSSLALPQN